MVDAPAGRRPRDETDRAEEVAESRRRRRTAAPAVDPSLRRFNLTEDFLDLDKFVYRSVPDQGNRLIDLTKNDDYDFVTAAGAKATSADATGVVRYQHATVDGAAKYTYLLRKPRQFAAEDRKAKDAEIANREAKALSQHTGEEPEQSYTPKR